MPQESLNQLIRHIYTVTDGRFKIFHLPGEINVADEPSRHKVVCPEKLEATRKMDEASRGVEHTLPTLTLEDDDRLQELLNDAADFAVSDEV